MEHMDLFSGIGGFAYSARIVWGKEYYNILFCDNNKFCQEVIKKNFGEKVLIYGDIRTVIKERVIADTAGIGLNRNDTQGAMEGEIATHSEQSGRGWSGGVKGCDSMDIRVDLLTGGFPCQPFSCAGQQRGKEDDRYLWDEMFRVIKEFKPTWVVGENVAGIISMAQQQSGLDVAGETDTEEGDYQYSESDGILCEIINSLECINYAVQTLIIPACAVNAPHRRDRVWIIAHRKRDASDAKGAECAKPGRTRAGWQGFADYGDWEENWIEVATELCRVDDGISNRVDRLKYSSARHRIERLKALGNSIVPQVVIEIFKAIKAVDMMAV